MSFVCISLGKLLPGFTSLKNLISPIYQVVYSSTKVYINCNSDGPKYWYKNGKSFFTNNVKSNDVYIDRAYEHHSGTYTCEGITADKQAFKVESVLLVAGM